MSENQDQPTNEQATVSEQPATNQQPAQGENRHDMGVEKVPAPSKPLPGSALAAPMTGSGPHRAPKLTAEEEDNAKKVTVPVIPQTKRPKRPSFGKRKGPLKPPQTQPATTQQPVDALPTTPPPVAQLPMHDPATASLLLATLNNQRQVGQKFITMVVAETAWPEINEHDSIDACITFIKQWLGTNSHVFAFMGQRMPISAGPNHFLHTPMGPMPLFDIPEPSDVNETEHGWVGDPLYLELPPQTEEPVLPGDDPEVVNDEAANEGDASTPPTPPTPPTPQGDEVVIDESGDTPLF